MDNFVTELFLFLFIYFRPEAVNISNMAALIDADGKPHFKYIVEGANLFLTQQARLHLEKRKVILFKDSSANKGGYQFLTCSFLRCSNAFCSVLGGVTSSSLEVLAGLALSTEEYTDYMIFKDGRPSAFYQSYVKDIQGKIVENAANEFSCIWKEHARLRGVKPRTTISDELSQTLNNLQAELECSDLYDHIPSRNGVMRRAIPKTLTDLLGLETLLSRLPEAYQRALFSSWVASHFVSYFIHFIFYSVLFNGPFAYCFHIRFTNTVSMAQASTFSTLQRISLALLRFFFIFSVFFCPFAQN